MSGAESEIEIDPNPTPEEEARVGFGDPVTERNRILNKYLEEDQKERKGYSKYAFRMTCGWISFLILIAFIQICLHKGLTQTEFVAVMTTTTASIFANWYLVGKYLFYRQVNFKKIKQSK